MPVSILMNSPATDLAYYIRGDDTHSDQCYPIVTDHIEVPVCDVNLYNREFQTPTGGYIYRQFYSIPNLADASPSWILIPVEMAIFIILDGDGNVMDAPLERYIETSLWNT